MTKLITAYLLLTSLFVSGCATQPFTCEERCSFTGTLCRKSPTETCAAPSSDHDYRQIVNTRTAADAKEKSNKRATQDSTIAVFGGMLLFFAIGAIAGGS